jgi:hypothetical protein
MQLYTRHYINRVLPVTRRSGYFPGTGAPEDTGSGAGRGRNVNVGWTPPLMRNRRGRLVPVDTEMPGDADYLLVWHNLVLPLAYEFEPELIIVSAGFDAADGDPMGGCAVQLLSGMDVWVLFGKVAALMLWQHGATACLQQPPAVLEHAWRVGLHTLWQYTFLAHVCSS